MLRSNLPAIRFTKWNKSLLLFSRRLFLILLDRWLGKPGIRRIPKIDVPPDKVFPMTYGQTAMYA